MLSNQECLNWPWFSHLLVKTLILEVFWNDFLFQDEVVQIAHSPKHLIKECKLGRRISHECHKLLSDNVTIIAIPDFGICYVYNIHPLITNSTEEINAPGPLHGLNLIFDLETHYNSRYGLTPSSGILLALNDARTMPTLKSKPIFLGKFSFKALYFNFLDFRSLWFRSLWFRSLWFRSLWFRSLWF